MKTSYLALASVLLLSSNAVAAADAKYHIAQRIKVPDGGFDYATFDSATGRVFMARTDFTTVIDTKTGRASQLNSGGGHLAVPVPGTSLLVIPQREDNARIIDEATDKVVANVPAAGAPDGAVYDPVSKHVYVMGHDGGIATVIDPIAKKVVAVIQVGGRLEFPATDGAGKVYVNVSSGPDIAVIDVKSNMVTAHYKLEGCAGAGATGLAYATQANLLISSCGNGIAKVLDATTGKEVASIPIADGPDAVIYDPVRRLAFIPCNGLPGRFGSLVKRASVNPYPNQGVLEVISVADPAHVIKI